jgi:hypothetical protein
MKKVVKLLSILAIIAFAFLVLINYSYSQQPRKWPFIFSGLDRMGTVLIDPETILSSLRRGEAEAFTIGLAETTDAEEVLWPGDEHYPGTITWMQVDHLFVANALNEFIWKDTLEELNLFSMDFNTTCQENVNGFRESRFRFFKPKFQWGIFSYS